MITITRHQMLPTSSPGREPTLPTYYQRGVDRLGRGGTLRAGKQFFSSLPSLSRPRHFLPPRNLNYPCVGVCFACSLPTQTAASRANVRNPNGFFTLPPAVSFQTALCHSGPSSYPIEWLGAFVSAAFPVAVDVAANQEPPWLNCCWGLFARVKFVIG